MEIRKEFSNNNGIEGNSATLNFSFGIQDIVVFPKERSQDTTIAKENYSQRPGKQVMNLEDNHSQLALPTDYGTQQSSKMHSGHQTITGKYTDPYLDSKSVNIGNVEAHFQYNANENINGVPRQVL